MTASIKEEIQGLTTSIDEMTEEREDGEVELTLLKRSLADAEARQKLLSAEEKDLAAEKERWSNEETEARNAVTTLQTERQRLAKIMFENKLKQQGIQLDRYGDDGLTLRPSSVFAIPPDFASDDPTTTDHDPGEADDSCIYLSRLKILTPNHY